jgi:ABC-type sugar transport system ATPase subunit
MRAVARTTAFAPKLIIMDEPTASLSGQDVVTYTTGAKTGAEYAEAA